jgi:hypothetical protein
MKRAVFTVALLLAACGDGRPRPARRPDAAVARPAMPPGHGMEIERLEATEPVTRVVGVLEDGTPRILPRGEQRDLQKGTALDTTDTGIVLDVGRAGRVTVDPRSRVEVFELEEADVLLREGVLVASQPVEGNSSRPALRIGTPRGTVVITSGGDALVVVARNGTVTVGAWSGVVEIRDGALPEGGGTARPRLLVGGGSYVLSAGREPIPVSMATGTAREALFRGQVAESLAAGRSARTCTAETESAATRLAALVERRARLEALRVRHVELARTRAPEAEEASRAIIAETQAVMREREATLVSLERAHACAASKDASPIAEDLARAREALAPAGRRP